MARLIFPFIRRCRNCYYVLEGLPGNRCPECGTDFDLLDPTTYTVKPPLVRWTYWLPGMILAAAGAVAMLLVIIPLAGFGYAATIATPICIGALLGYGLRVPKLVLGTLAVAVAVGTVTGLYSAGILGIYCGIVMGLILCVPILFGIFVGWCLREILKYTSFSQRFHLPTLMVLIFMALPLLGAWLESRWRGPAAIEAVSTRVDMPVSLPRAWDGVVFYENVEHEPPFLLRHILPRPLYARGSTAHVGDRTVCVYSKGKLIKQVTQREPGKLLAFDVVSQVNIENRSIRLTDGCFAFASVDSAHTRVVLTTRYEPLLTPRWIWRPFEALAVHELHGHVLEGMRRKAMASHASPVARGRQLASNADAERGE